MGAMPVLIYCADGNPKFAAAAVERGWKYGARLPGWTGQPIYFADQDWKKPNRDAYVLAVGKARPEVATVLDWEEPSQLAEVLSWAEELAPKVAAIVIIPKVPGGVSLIPDRIGGVEVILGYSVPTSYGGTAVPLWEFGRRPVHLLGGSPQRQLDLADYLNVVSLDGGMAQQQANRCRYWSRKPGPKGHWNQLNSEQLLDANLHCFCLTLEAVFQTWQSRKRSP